MWHISTFHAHTQVLKRMLEMSNYKTAPATAMKIWAAKHSLNLSDANRSEWFEDDVTPSSEFMPIQHQHLGTSQSFLMRMCASDSQSISSYRFLSAFTRGPLDINVNTWVLISVKGGGNYAGYLGEMAQIVLGSASVIRMRLSECREVEASALEVQDHLISSNSMVCVQKSVPGRSMLARLEQCGISGLAVEDRGDHLAFRYVW